MRTTIDSDHLLFIALWVVIALVASGALSLIIAWVGSAFVKGG
jgi:hypothetical protein